MVSLVDLVFDELSEAHLRALAERLRPFLAPQTPDDGWLDGIDAIAEYLGCPPSRLYDPVYRDRSGIPLCKVGRGWAAKKSELDTWAHSRS